MARYRSPTEDPPCWMPNPDLQSSLWPQVTDSHEPLPLDALLLTATDPEITGGHYAGPETAGSSRFNTVSATFRSCFRS